MAHHSSRRLSRTGTENRSFSEGIFSPSAEAITYVLANITPQEFHSEVFKAFTEAPLSVTQRQIDDFLATLKTAGIPHAAAAERAVAEETVRHCARCHHNYLEKHNGRIACSILHDDPQPQPGPDFEPVVYIIPCCPSATDGNPYHFIGRHTTVAKAVAYNTSNVRECFPGCSGHRSLSSAGSDDMSATATSRSSTPTATTSEFEAEIQATFADYTAIGQSSARSGSSFSNSGSEEANSYMGY